MCSSNADGSLFGDLNRSSALVHHIMSNGIASLYLIHATHSPSLTSSPGTLLV
jgi:hypothetical protein